MKKQFDLNLTGLFAAIFALAPAGCKDSTDYSKYDSGLDFDFDFDSDSDYGKDSDSNSDSDSDSSAGADSDSDADDYSCSDGLDLIYTVDQNNILYSFDPMAAPSDAFRQIGDGPLNCAAEAFPFSMSVGRDGYAYVLFVRQRLTIYECVGVYRVDIHTGECLGVIPFSCGTQGFNTFGMGFVTISENSTDEELYVGNAVAPADLATLDVETGRIEPKGSMEDVGPEFTGNALGELWGFFPQATPPNVAQIDKSSGAVMQSFDLSTLPSMTHAWAFAFWGGAFYIFYKSVSDASTNVYKLEDGALTKHISDSGKTIVGAGVSTCAPVLLE